MLTHMAERAQGCEIIERVVAELAAFDLMLNLQILKRAACPRGSSSEDTRSRSRTGPKPPPIWWILFTGD
jgi:hypothetical protein